MNPFWAEPLCFRYLTWRRVWRRCRRTWPSWCLWRRGPHSRAWPKWSPPCCKRWTTPGGDPSSRPPAPPGSWSSTPAGRDTTRDRQLGNGACGDHGHMQAVKQASNWERNMHSCHGESVAKGSNEAGWLCALTVFRSFVFIIPARKQFYFSLDDLYWNWIDRW